MLQQEGAALQTLHVVTTDVGSAYCMSDCWVMIEDAEKKCQSAMNTPALEDLLDCPAFHAYRRQCGTPAAADSRIFLDMACGTRHNIPESRLL